MGGRGGGACVAAFVMKRSNAAIVAIEKKTDTSVRDVRSFWATEWPVGSRSPFLALSRRRSSSVVGVQQQRRRAVRLQGVLG